MNDTKQPLCPRCGQPTHEAGKECGPCTLDAIEAEAQARDADAFREQETPDPLRWWERP